jgi:hypothetical protein
MTFVYSEAIKINYVQLKDLPLDTTYYATPNFSQDPSLIYRVYSKDMKWYEDIESMGTDVFNFIEEQKQKLADPAKAYEGMMSESEYKDKYKDVDQNQNQDPHRHEYWELDLVEVEVKIDEEDLSLGEVNVRAERHEDGLLYAYRYRYNYERCKEAYRAQNSAKPLTLIKCGLGAAQVLKVSKNLDDFPQSLHATLPKTSSECAEGWYYVNATYMSPEKYSEYKTKLAEVNALLERTCHEYMVELSRTENI